MRRRSLSACVADFSLDLAKEVNFGTWKVRATSGGAESAKDIRVEEYTLPLIAAGKVKPVIYKTFPLKEAAAAHALMESSAHIGKIVLEV